jgi:hypothetical protein
LPEYEPDRFREFTDEELRAFERNTVVACCPDEPLEDVSVTTWGYDSRRHYTQPEWWLNIRYAPERLRPLDRAVSRAERTVPSSAVPSVAPAREAYDRELVTARDRAVASKTDSDADPSPHLDGRAQPGDVIGIETGGERTSIGDTVEDENARRRDAERTAADSDARSSDRERARRRDE